MKWEEVRKLYPNQFVKIQILKSYFKDDKVFVEDIAIIES